MADSTDHEMTDAQANGGENGGDSGASDDRKLFVGRLSWESTEKDLRDHFSQYGEVETVSLKTDPQTGRSRGFAFVVFKEAEGINRVLDVTDHVINNKKVDPKKAKARHGKIFVGGVDIEITEEEIREYFGQFGAITEIELPMDRSKNVRKNFCFVTFESEAVTNEILKSSKQTLKGKEVDVKKANPKGPDGLRGGRGGRGGRGAPRGGRGGWNQGYGSGGYGGYGGYGGGFGYDYYNGGGYGGGGGGGGYNGGYDYSGGYGGQYGSGYGNSGGKPRGRGQRAAPY